MSLEVPRFCFQAFCKVIESLGASPLFGFDNAQVAVSVGDAILLRDGLEVVLGGAVVSFFVEYQCILEGAQPRLKLQHLRRRLRKEVQLRRVFNLCAPLRHPLVAELGRADREFQYLRHGLLACEIRMTRIATKEKFLLESGEFDERTRALFIPSGPGNRQRAKSAIDVPGHW